MERLRKDVISGGRWMLLRQVLGQPIRIVVSILLTRIIAPADFGLVAKSLAITGVIELVFVNGLYGSIVQSKSIDQKELNALFAFSVILSFLVSTVLYFTASPIASFYNDSRVIWVIELASVSIFISGIRLVFNALLNKNLRFKYLAIINVVATVISSGAALILAHIGFGYKALIYQVLVLNIVISIGSIIYSGWRPKFKFSKAGLRHHLAFSTKVILNNLLNYAVRNTDNIAIGKFQNDIQLGFYSRAYFLMLMPINQVGQIFSSTLFPAFSKIQSDKQRILSILNQAQEIIIVLVYPIIIWGFINIDFFVSQVLGDGWIPSAIYFKIFIPLMLTQIFTAQISNVYMALNKMGTMLRISLITKPLIISVIIWMAMEGAINVAISITILSIFFGILIYVKGLSFLGKGAIKTQINYLRETLWSTAILFIILGLSYFAISDEINLLVATFIFLLVFYLSILKFRSDLKVKFLELFKLG